MQTGLRHIKKSINTAFYLSVTHLDFVHKLWATLAQWTVPLESAATHQLVT